MRQYDPPPPALPEHENTGDKTALTGRFQTTKNRTLLQTPPHLLHSYQAVLILTPRSPALQSYFVICSAECRR
jgi:hypothetical protein